MKRVLLPLLLLAAAAAPADAASWADWAPAPHSPLRGRFEPFADTRPERFYRGDPSGYASVHALTPHPGDLVLEPAPGASPPAGPLEVRVEAARVPRDRTVAPVLPWGAHYASNPHLPFPPPAGEADPPLFVSVRRTGPAPAFPLRVPVRLDSWGGYGRSVFDGYPNGGLVHVRWEVRDASGATLARGVLPDAFSEDVSVTFIDAAAEEAAPSPENVAARATPATETAWAALSDGIGAVWLDAGSSLAEDDDEAFARFARRARLLGVRTEGADPPTRRCLRDAAGWPLGADLLRPGHKEYGENGVKPLSETIPGLPGTLDNPDANDAEEKLAAARVPGALLGRSVGPFLRVTFAFLLVYAVGAGVVLVRHFAFRRGERRLAVWRALPLWALVCTAVALFVLPLLPDRAPRADVTEWRFGIDGLPEALVIADGRAQTFASESTAWSVPADGWFAGEPRTHHSLSSGTGPCAVETFDDAAGVRTLRGPGRDRGDPESVRAMRFVPHESPVSLSPDPDADEEFFRSELPGPSDEQGAPSEWTDSAWLKLLREWTISDMARFQEPFRAVRTPDRTVTAREDLDGVWVFARGQWYALGAMGAGASVALSPAMRLRSPPSDRRDDGTRVLFRDAPFLLDLSAIVPVAEAELARRSPPAAPAAEAGPPVVVPSPAASATSGASAPSVPKLDGDFLARLDGAFVVAVRHGAGGRTSLRPVAEDGGEPFVEDGRIVWMELFP